MKPMNLAASTKITIFWSMFGLFVLLIWAALWASDPTWKVWLAVGGIFMGTKVAIALMLEAKAQGYRFSSRGQRRVRWALASGWVVIVVVHVVFFGAIALLWARGDYATSILLIKSAFPVLAVMGIFIGFISRPTVKYWGQPH